MSSGEIHLPRQSTEDVFEIPKEIPLEELPTGELHEYLHALKKTVWTTMTTMLLSVVVGVPALCALIEFRRSGTSFMHPYLAMFLTLGSIALFSIAVFSASKAKNRLQSAVGRLLRSYYERL